MENLHFIYGPEHWHQRAAEARGLAAQLNDPEAMRAMLKIADRYGLLAERAERRAANGSTQTGGGLFGDRLMLREALSRHSIALMKPFLKS
jgi:hypothetical protein